MAPNFALSLRRGLEVGIEIRQTQFDGERGLAMRPQQHLAVEQLHLGPGHPAGCGQLQTLKAPPAIRGLFERDLRAVEDDLQNRNLAMLDQQVTIRIDHDLGQPEQRRGPVGRLQTDLSQPDLPIRFERGGLKLDRQIGSHLLQPLGNLLPQHGLAATPQPDDTSPAHDDDRGEKNEHPLQGLTQRHPAIRGGAGRGRGAHSVRSVRVRWQRPGIVSGLSI